MSEVVDGRSRRGRVRGDSITMAHGSGGKAMQDLIDDVFVSTFASPELLPLEDQARLELGDRMANRDRLALTTDCYVVDPLFFPGGDIGKLAVAGTVNDLAVGGATPLYLTCGMIVEEGLPLDTLRRVVTSMKITADSAGVSIVTGDTKVVPRGVADKLFINTAGVGIIPEGVEISAHRAQSGDLVLVNGFVGDHGAAVVDARGELALENSIETDCQPLNGLVAAMLATGADIHCMRDATRGGLATVLNEFARASNVCIHIDEQHIPVREEVRGVCEILGLDPLYLANEGKLVAVVAETDAEDLLEAMRRHPAGPNSVVVGAVKPAPAATVVMTTPFGGERIVDLLVSEQLPRIC